jgi:low temperature requirement protein LtrA
MAERLRHDVRRMAGRDPEEQGRASTPLELLFDLTFVIAFGVASDELARLLAAGHTAPAIEGFVFATFAVAWAWVNFSWFASAYDTDDWIFRLTTMVQMVGVLVLALGLNDMFDSLVRGKHVDNRLMVLGYVVMRVAMLMQWLRASREDPGRRELCQVMAATIAVAQVGWVLLLAVDLSASSAFLCYSVLILVELGGPIVAETRFGGTPWHGDHMAERYGLMVIITLGEGLLGTTDAMRALISEGWTQDIVVLGLAGVAMTFGVWWSYFVVPYGALLTAYRGWRAFVWGYGQIPLFGSIVAIGAGLHVAALKLEGHSTLTVVGTVTAVVLPMAGYVLISFVIYALTSGWVEQFHYFLLGFSTGCLALAIALAGAGAPMVWCLAVVAAVPWITVVGYELVGYRHHAAVLAALPHPSS